VCVWVKVAVFSNYIRNATHATKVDSHLSPARTLSNDRLGVTARLLNTEVNDKSERQRNIDRQRCQSERHTPDIQSIVTKALKGRPQPAWSNLAVGHPTDVFFPASDQ
jgi:hypothetical protein